MCGFHTDNNLIVEFFDSCYCLQRELRKQCCKVTARAADNGKPLLTAMKGTLNRMGAIDRFNRTMIIAMNLAI